MKRIKTWAAAHSVLSTIIVMLAITGTAAAAAWIIYTGAQGAGSGQKFGTASGGLAVSFADDVAKDNTFAGLVPGGSESTYVLATNNAGVAEQLTGDNGTTFTSNPSDCAAHLHVNPALFTTPPTIAANATNAETLLTNAITADASVPNDCSGATWTVNFKFTTSP